MASFAVTSGDISSRASFLVTPRIIQENAARELFALLLAIIWAPLSVQESPHASYIRKRGDLSPD
jgi:hypothetical protein